MIVTDLSKEFHPVPKNKKNIKLKKEEKSKTIKDFCIMPRSTKYSTIRTEKYCERHEVYFSRTYRKKSIKDGLVVFLTREKHRGTEGPHGKNGDKFNRYLKRKGQEAWMKYYNKTKEEFLERYGRNYL